MSYFNGTKNIPKFGGNVWYVSKAYGDDTNDGKSPTTPFGTIGKAIAILSEGDAINIMAGTYTEVGLDLNVNACELWFEIGVIIAPATGTGLVISADYCLTKGNHQINGVAGEIGKLLTGDYCHIDDGRIVGGSIGLSVVGVGSTINHYACGNQTNMSYDLEGGRTRVTNCSTVGVGASYGYHINNSSDTGVLKDCTSVGHELSGYYIGMGSKNWTIIDCSTGGADGKWRDVDTSNVFSGFTYPETKYKCLTLDNTHEYNLFKITGAVEIEEIYGHVDVALTGNNSSVYWDLYSASSEDTITKVTGADMGAAVVGSVIMKTEDPDKSALFFDGAGVGVDKGIDPKKKKVVLNANGTEDTYIRWICGGNDDTSGDIHFHIVWRPLTDDGFVVVV